MDYYPKDGVLPSVWNEYTKDSEYIIERKIYGIRVNHPIVLKREARGVKELYENFVVKKLRYKIDIDKLPRRTPSEWLNEWKAMHSMLFKYLLPQKHKGKWRTKNVRFGAPGDEDKQRHNVPDWHFVPNEVENLANNLKNSFLAQETEDNDKKYEILATVHYQFIRIHPFRDGNGRVTRAMTDQIASYFGLPPVLCGYPRQDSGRRKKYHEAITNCIGDPTCCSLKIWIQSYIEEQLSHIS